MKGLHKEATRKLKGYIKDDPARQVKANIRYENSSDNIELLMNDCMLDCEKGCSSIKNLYFEKVGRPPKKNAVAASLIITLPKDQIEYSCPELKNQEYVAYTKFLEAQISGNHLSEHEKELALSAMDKFTHINWTDAQKEQIRDYFTKMLNPLCSICGIKESDVLYAVVHMDESFPHLHFAFLPMQYGKKTFDKAIELSNEDPAQIKRGKSMNSTPYIDIGSNRVNLYSDKRFVGLTNYSPKEEEPAQGCSVKRFKKGFLHQFNQLLKHEMLEQGIETNLSNGKGQQFKVLEQTKVSRMVNASLEQEEYRLQRSIKEKQKNVQKLDRKTEQLQTKIEDQQAILFSTKSGKRFYERKGLSKLYPGCEDLEITVSYKDAKALENGQYASEQLKQKEHNLICRESDIRQKERELKALESDLSKRIQNFDTELQVAVKKECEVQLPVYVQERIDEADTQMLRANEKLSQAKMIVSECNDYISQLQHSKTFYDVVANAIYTWSKENGININDFISQIVQESGLNTNIIPEWLDSTVIEQLEKDLYEYDSILEDIEGIDR